MTATCSETVHGYGDGAATENSLRANRRISRRRACRHWICPRRAKTAWRCRIGKCRTSEKPGCLPVISVILMIMAGVPIQVTNGGTFTPIQVHKPPNASATPPRNRKFPPGTDHTLVSSPGNGIVLDPFCGCGTTIAAARRAGPIRGSRWTSHTWRSRSSSNA